MMIPNALMGVPEKQFCDEDLPKTKIQPIHKQECSTQLLSTRLLADPEHRQRIERIARKQTRGTNILWEDAAQTAHIKILLAVQAGKFRYGDVEAFFHWAAAIARFEIIDLVRKDKQRYWQSLDQPILGTESPLLDSIADDFNLLDSIERADLIYRALDALHQLDRQYPERNYLKLWQGQVAGKNQTQLSTELGLTQGAVSKRWKELIHRIAEALGLLQEVESKDLKPQGLKSTGVEFTPPLPAKGVRARSTEQW